jgi:hypothetical protein
MAIALALQVLGRREQGNCVGQEVSSVLILDRHTTLVKLADFG